MPAAREGPRRRRSPAPRQGGAEAIVNGLEEAHLNRPARVAATSAEALGFGSRPPARQSRDRYRHDGEFRIVSIRKVRTGALRAFGKIQLSSGLVIHDVLIFEKGGSRWAMLPSRPVLDTEGRQVTIEGKKQYSPVCEWPSKELGRTFSRVVCRLVAERFPDVFDAEAGE